MKQVCILLFTLCFLFTSLGQSEILVAANDLFSSDEFAESVLEEEKSYRKKRRRKKRSRKRRLRKKKKKDIFEIDLEDSSEEEVSDFQRYGNTSEKKRRRQQFTEPEKAKGEDFDWEKAPRGRQFFLGLPSADFIADKLSGELQFEGRAFEKIDAESEETADTAAAVFLRLQQSFSSESDKWEAKAKAFARFDAIDSGRNIVFPEDVWVSYTEGFYQFRLGFQNFNWTQMDIFQPAELLNSVNFDSEIENLEKIGEFALTFKMKLSFGFLQAIYMPLVFPAHFPSSKSRFSLLEPGQEMGDPIYVKKDGTLVEKKQFNQFAFNFSKSFDDFDLNLFFVDQIDRRVPEIVFQTSSNSFRPVFFPIATYGMNIIYPKDEWVFKAETVRRLVTNPVQPTIFGELQKKSHSLISLGVERGFDWSGKSITAFVEYQRVFGLSDDGESAEELALEEQKITVFQNDAAVGIRINFNDIKGREIRLLADVDLDVSSQILASIVYKQRFAEVWETKIGYRYISAPQQAAIKIGLEEFDQDNYGFLLLTRYF